MLPIRAQTRVLQQSSANRKPTAREQKPQALEASFRNARDLADQVHHWYVAARHHLTQAHHCDQQIVRLQHHLQTLERTLGRASPVLIGTGASLLAFGELLHAGAVSHGALGLLMAGAAGHLTWVGGIVGLKRRIIQLTQQHGEAQDKMQQYTRLAAALDPQRLAPAPPEAWSRGLQRPRPMK